MLEEQHEEASAGGRVVSSAPNFFDLFGLNSNPPNKPLPQPPSAEEEEDDTDSKSGEGFV